MTTWEYVEALQVRRRSWRKQTKEKKREQGKEEREGVLTKERRSLSH